MAKITIANKTSKPICSNGAMAFIMDLSTTWRPAKQNVNYNQKPLKQLTYSIDLDHSSYSESQKFYKKPDWNTTWK